MASNLTGAVFPASFTLMVATLKGDAMDMDNDIGMDPVGHRATTGFPVSSPLDALRHDHEFVRKLFIRFLNTDDDAIRREAGPLILSLLETHSLMEESVFYPQVRQLDSTLITEFLEEHAETDQLVQQLKSMDAAEPDAEPIYRRLCEAVLHHIDDEEHRLFPTVEQADLDLETIGLQMQAFESNIVSSQARGVSSQRAR